MAAKAGRCKGWIVLLFLPPLDHNAGIRHGQGVSNLYSMML